MTILEFKTKIQTGEINVAFGDIFMGVKEPINYLCEKIDRYQESFLRNVEFLKDSFKDKPEIITQIDQISFTKEGLIKPFRFHDLMFLNSWITGNEHQMRLIDNRLDFVEYDFNGLERVIFKKDYAVTTEVVTTLNVPSKKLVFTNYFEDMGDIPEEERYKHNGKYSVGSVIGRRNLRKYLAETHNLGYGQTGNMSVELYSNGKEILGLDFNVECVDEMFYGDSIEEIQPLINRLEKENFVYYGSISCCVWRIDFVDFNSFKESTHVRNVVTIPINGTKVEHRHYDNDCLKSQFGEHLLFSIKCV